MSEQATKEVPFVSAFEHAPESSHEATIKVGRNLWSIHGMTHRILESLGIVQSRALSMAERGPEDYAETGYERGFSAGQRHGGYREAPKPEGNLKTIIVSCTVALLSAFFIGAWKLSNDSAALRAEFNEWKTSTVKWMDKTDDRMRQLENQRR